MMRSADVRIAVKIRPNKAERNIITVSNNQIKVELPDEQVQSAQVIMGFIKPTAQINQHATTVALLTCSQDAWTMLQRGCTTKFTSHLNTFLTHQYFSENFWVHLWTHLDSLWYWQLLLFRQVKSSTNYSLDTGKTFTWLDCVWRGWRITNNLWGTLKKSIAEDKFLVSYPRLSIVIDSK